MNQRTGLILSGLLVFTLIAVMGYLVWDFPPSPLPTGTPHSVAVLTPISLVTPDTETPTSDLCAGVVSTVQSAIPLRGVQFSSPGGATRAVSLWGVTTGEARQEKSGGRYFDLARLFYLSDDGELRALWFATGFVDGKGRYFPMNIPNPRREQAWETRQDSAMIFIFSPPGRGIRLTLTGFLRGDQEIAWEECNEWAPFNPAGICTPGLDLELASHGASAQFLQSSIAPEGPALPAPMPQAQVSEATASASLSAGSGSEVEGHRPEPAEGWFAFGWAVEFSGADAELPDHTGGCVP